jgi:putative thiamine transport system permease protein
MAAALRRLGFNAVWLLVLCVALMPVLGIVLGLWPTQTINLNSLNTFLSYKGLFASVSMTLFTALFSTLISLYIAFWVYSQYHMSRGWQSLEKYLAPMLSMPHLAVAMGLVFLFSDGSFIFTEGGLPRKSLLTLILAIVIKEVPFFLLIFTAIGRQLPIQQWLLQSRALGYAKASGWWFLVFPAVLKQSRLALLAATAYTLSVVDISLLVGPNIPELFAVSLYRWQSSFSSGNQELAFWANALLIVLLIVSVLILYAHEKLISTGLKTLSVLGSRFGLAKFNPIFVAWLPVSAMLSVLMLVVFALWSLGFGWHLPGDIWQTINFELWQNEWFFVALPLQNSMIIALIAAMLGIALALLCLELQHQKQRYWPDYLWLLAILLPQLSMVLGWQIAHIWLEGSYHLGWIIASHLPFTFAYAYLVLKGPFQSLETRYELIAASFGYSAWQSWWKVRFRLLLPAILSAFAIAFSVSIAQYIPTLMLGAGRVATITTEAVAIGTGNQQNVIALYMLLQSVLPFVAFLLAAILAYQFRSSMGAGDVRNN